MDGPLGGFISWRFQGNGKIFEAAPETALILDHPHAAVRLVLDGISLRCRAAATTP
ncbi:MAG: hypothetical protein ACREED_11065 [Stellaceae bacterium]